MTNAVKKIVRTYFGKTEISIDGLMEVFEQTGNADVALDILLGTYEQPEIPKEAQIWGRECTLKSFDKWSSNVHYTFIADRKDHISIRKGIDIKTITPENYKEYQVKHNEPGAQYAFVPVEADYQHNDSCKLEEWIEGFERLQKVEDKKATSSSNDVTPTSAFTISGASTTLTTTITAEQFDAGASLEGVTAIDFGPVVLPQVQPTITEIFTGHAIQLIDIVAVGPVMNQFKKESWGGSRRMYVEVNLKNGVTLNYWGDIQQLFGELTQEQRTKWSEELAEIESKRAGLIDQWSTYLNSL